MKAVFVLAALALFAATVNAQSVSYSWSGGTINFYNYNYTQNSTGTFLLCAPQPINNTVIGTASGNGATVGTLGCVQATTASAWANPNTYTVSCFSTTGSVGGFSGTSTILSGKEYATKDACNNKGTDTGRILTGASSSGTGIPTVSTFGTCWSSYSGSGLGNQMNYVSSCPTSAAFNTIPSVLVVAAALATAFFATKQ